MVHEVTDQSFQEVVVDSDIPCVVGFTAGWCTLCGDMVQAMEELSEELDGKVRFCVVNIDEQRKLRIMFAVAAVPYIVYVHRSMKTPLFDELVTKDRLLERIQHMLDGGGSPTTAPLGKMR